jgi:hypothetical protein
MEKTRIQMERIWDKDFASFVKELEKCLAADNGNHYPHCEACWNRFHNGLRDKDFDKAKAPPWTHEGMV